MKVYLVPLADGAGGPKPVPIPIEIGTTVLGRGPLLKITDDRVSRRQAEIHVSPDGLFVKVTSVGLNPTYILPKGETKPIRLDQGKTLPLYTADQLWLIGLFKYTLLCVPQAGDPPAPVRAGNTIVAGGPAAAIQAAGYDAYDDYDDYDDDYDDGYGGGGGGGGGRGPAPAPPPRAGRKESKATSKRKESSAKPRKNTTTSGRNRSNSKVKPSPKKSNAPPAPPPRPHMTSAKKSNATSRRDDADRKKREREEERKKEEEKERKRKEREADAKRKKEEAKRKQREDDDRKKREAEEARLAAEEEEREAVQAELDNALDSQNPDEIEEAILNAKGVLDKKTIKSAEKTLDEIYQDTSAIVIKALEDATAGDDYWAFKGCLDKALALTKYGLSKEDRAYYESQESQWKRQDKAIKAIEGAKKLGGDGVAKMKKAIKEAEKVQKEVGGLEEWVKVAKDSLKEMEEQKQQAQLHGTLADQLKQRRADVALTGRFEDAVPGDVDEWD